VFFRQYNVFWDRCYDFPQKKLDKKL
jgi:hypothetical protein